MTTEASTLRGRRREPAAGSGRRPGLHVTGVVGELMVTVGVFLLAFVAWQLWWTDVEGDRAQAAIVEGLDWVPVPGPPEASAPSAAAAPAIEPRRDAAPAIAQPGHAVTFATLLVPRWGADYERPVSQGVDRAGVLDPLGIGHYPDTAMPGDVGNFAISGHRTTYGKPFTLIADLVAGDPIVVRTADTWYVYRVTTTEIVKPSDVDVIAPVPRQPGAAPTERMITLTTCHPMYSARERYIVYGTLDYWLPTSAGFPPELTGGV